MKMIENDDDDDDGSGPFNSNTFNYHHECVLFDFVLFSFISIHFHFPLVCFSRMHFISIFFFCSLFIVELAAFVFEQNEALRLPLYTVLLCLHFFFVVFFLSLLCRFLNWKKKMYERMEYLLLFVVGICIVYLIFILPRVLGTHIFFSFQFNGTKKKKTTIFNKYAFDQISVAQHDVLTYFIQFSAYVLISHTFWIR